MDAREIAEEVIAASREGAALVPFSERLARFDLSFAYRVAAEVRALRLARGETPIGRKIGFTNRTIWPEYGVWAPIWGYVYDSTLRDFAQLAQDLPLQGLAEPRIEPEIVFGIARAPQTGMDEAALLDCIDWIAHGFEIVQSLYPGWRFAAADTVAAFGLHGVLVLGPRQALGAARDDWRAALAGFEIDLLCDGSVVDHGRSGNVLDGPLSALRHLVQLLGSDATLPPLRAGEIVTTGTLTRALPIAAGQIWSTQLAGIELPGLNLRFL